MTHTQSYCITRINIKSYQMFLKGLTSNTLPTVFLVSFSFKTFYGLTDIHITALNFSGFHLLSNSFNNWNI